MIEAKNVMPSVDGTYVPLDLEAQDQEPRIEHDARVESLSKELHEYVQLDNADAVRDLLSNDGNLKLFVEGLYQSPYSSLHYAVDNACGDVLVVLLDKLPLDVWLLRTEESGRTPLMLTADKGKGEHPYSDGSLLDILIEQIKYNRYWPTDRSPDLVTTFAWEDKWTGTRNEGIAAIVNATDLTGNTALHLAFERENWEFCAKLIAADAKTDIANDEGKTVHALMQGLSADVRLFRLIEDCSTVSLPQAIRSLFLDWA
ncbi:hypothetical protein [Bordetella sp. 02P26C-1]|uniref:hypothetical protein n=1 Tax=Bordetella sp. 02P26C-1 TaxID=2683195 RepID=UPI0013524697|nr:hypothetical protein [Bordetella sp. 02P26C-1]MVW78919.1 hypothetical protein [Bordetella sp. 02P26C-1]